VFRSKWITRAELDEIFAAVVKVYVRQQGECECRGGFRFDFLRHIIIRHSFAPGMACTARIANKGMGVVPVPSRNYGICGIADRARASGRGAANVG
jgi:hypothetical protein